MRAGCNTPGQKGRCNEPGGSHGGVRGKTAYLCFSSSLCEDLCGETKTELTSPPTARARGLRPPGGPETLQTARVVSNG